MNFLKIVLTAALFVAAPTWAGDLTDPQNNAIRSAKQYLNMTGFSCKGLIKQLTSSAGDKYTVDQATYGAKQAGGC
ncbi:Ltp family lipoprotein [Pantoea sp. B9002]|nr:Ltp family lipoprotein [Pantoea sp. B9002]